MAVMMMMAVMMWWWWWWWWWCWWCWWWRYDDDDGGCDGISWQQYMCIYIYPIDDWCHWVVTPKPCQVIDNKTTCLVDAIKEIWSMIITLMKGLYDSISPTI
jgi:hypothetical protein